MKNMGTFNPNRKPVKPGGLTKEDREKLEVIGWKREVTGYDVTDVDIGFAEPDLPHGFTLFKFNVPAGTEYYYNAADGAAVLSDCGNPTCWRWLV